MEVLGYQQSEPLWKMQSYPPKPTWPGLEDLKFKQGENLDYRNYSILIHHVTLNSFLQKEKFYVQSEQVNIKRRKGKAPSRRDQKMGCLLKGEREKSTPRNLIKFSSTQ